MTSKRDIEQRIERLESDTPSAKYSEADLSLTVEEKQVLDGFFSVDSEDMYGPTDPEMRALFEQFNDTPQRGEHDEQTLY